MFGFKVTETKVTGFTLSIVTVGFRGGAVVKNPPPNAGDTRDVGSIPGLGRSPGGGHGNPPQYSCLEKSKDRGAWQATVHGVTESDMTEHTCTQIVTDL